MEKTMEKSNVKDPNFLIRTQYVKDQSFENPNAPEVYAMMAKEQPNLDISIDDKCVRVRIAESGNDLELEDMSAPELKSWIEHARSTELGVFLIRQIMDEVDYTYRKGTENRLELVKHLDGAA